MKLQFSTAYIKDLQTKIFLEPVPDCFAIIKYCLSRDSFCTFPWAEFMKKGSLK